MTLVCDVAALGAASLPATAGTPPGHLPPRRPASLGVGLGRHLEPDPGRLQGVGRYWEPSVFETRA